MEDLSKCYRCEHARWLIARRSGNLYAGCFVHDNGKYLRTCQDERGGSSLGSWIFRTPERCGPDARYFEEAEIPLKEDITAPNPTYESYMADIKRGMDRLYDLIESDLQDRLDYAAERRRKIWEE